MHFASTSAAKRGNRNNLRYFKAFAYLYYSIDRSFCQYIFDNLQNAAE